MEKNGKFDGAKSPFPVSDFEKSIKLVINSSKHEVRKTYIKNDEDEPSLSSSSSNNVFKQLKLDLKQERESKILIEKMCPPELKLKIRNRKLNYIRLWIIMQNFVYLLV